MGVPSFEADEKQRKETKRKETLEKAAKISREQSPRVSFPELT